MGNRFLVPTVNPAGMTLLSTTTLSGVSTTITIGANNYQQLVVTTQGITSGTNHNPFIQINSITGGSDYIENRIGQNDGTGFGPTAAKRAGMYLNFPGSYGYGTGATNFSITTFFNPNDTSVKYVESQGYFNNGVFLTRLGDFVVNASAVISSLVFKSDQSITGGTLKVYGVN